MNVIKIFIFYFLFTGLIFADNKTLVFAPLPLKDIKSIHTQFSPMIRYLQKKLKTKIKIDYNTSYDEILRKFEKGEIDIAYLGPLPYLSLDERYPYVKPLVNFRNKKGAVSYTCSFVSFISTTNKIKSLQNTKIALTQPLSTCGYLFVNDILKNFNTNIEENKYRYLGRHDKVALSVIRDEFTYGGLKSDIAKEYFHLGLKEIKQSEEIPNFILVANTKTIKNDVINNIKNSMISIDKDELELWHKSLKYGTKETKDEDYDHLRKLIKSTKIPHESNF